MKETTRKIKCVRFTMQHKLPEKEVEDKVNNAIDELVAQGKKIVSITHYTVQSSPIVVMYNIVYETVV